MIEPMTTRKFKAYQAAIALVSDYAKANNVRLTDAIRLATGGRALWECTVDKLAEIAEKGVRE